MNAERSNLRPVVLIVDDDEIRRPLRLLFEFDDFEVVEASDGPTAVACALRDGPEFIVLDDLMPGMAVEKVAPVLRSLLPEARIVAFSVLLEAKPDWADAFLNKDRIAEVSGVLTALLPHPVAGAV